MKKVISAIAAATLVVLSLVGCSPMTSLVPGSTISIGELSSLDSFNADVPTSQGAQEANSDLANLIRPSFFTLDSAGKLVPNTAFGSVKVLSQSPFKVAYKLTGKAKWTDGQQVSAADLMLSWLAARDPLQAGFVSVARGTGLQFTSAIPEISADGLSLTITYDHPVADYKTDLTVSAAAHSVAARAFDLANDPTAAVKRMTASVAASNIDDEMLLATHYVNAYRFTELNQNNPALLLSAGAYNVVSFKAGEGITLKANPSFNWGNTPRVETVNIRLFSDATSILAAMQTKSVDMASLAESGLATLSSLVSIAKSNSDSYRVTASNDIEAVLVNYGADSIFGAKSAANATVLRDSILKLIPRSKIQYALNGDSPVIDARSWVYSNASNYYQPFVQSNGSTNYMIQQAEVAAEQMAKLSIAKPVSVRVLYDSDNPRAKQEFELLGQYAASAGFALVDVSSKEPNDVVKTGEFDLYITIVPLAGEVGGSPYWFTATGLTAFADSKLSDLLVQYGSKLKEIDQISVLKDIDSEIYSAGFGLPLYQVPSLLVYSKRVKATVPAPYGGSATYGYWNWQLAGN